jgi:hypothetical protein
MKQKIIDISITVGSCMGILTAVWIFTQDTINNHILEVVEKYEETIGYRAKQDQAFTIFLGSATFKETLNAYISTRTPDNVGFRKILAIKLGVSEEEVANEIARLFKTVDEDNEENKRNKQRLFNTLRLLNKLYPEENVWNTD